MLCARAAVCFCEMNKCRCRDQKYQNSNFHDRENDTLNRLHLIGTFQSVSFFQEKYASQNSNNKSNQPKNGVPVTACKTKDHTERTTKEHQASDHNEHSNDKTGDRCRAASWLEFFGCKGQDAGTKNQSHNLRTYVLHCRCGMKSQGTCGITQETCNTETHICRVSEIDQSHCNDSNDDARSNDHRRLFL